MRREEEIRKVTTGWSLILMAGAIAFQCLLLCWFWNDWSLTSRDWGDDLTFWEVAVTREIHLEVRRGEPAPLGLVFLQLLKLGWSYLLLPAWIVVRTVRPRVFLPAWADATLRAVLAVMLGLGMIFLSGREGRERNPWVLYSRGVLLERGQILTAEHRNMRPECRSRNHYELRSWVYGFRWHCTTTRVSNCIAPMKGEAIPRGYRMLVEPPESGFEGGYACLYEVSHFMK